MDSTLPSAGTHSLRRGSALNDPRPTTLVTGIAGQLGMHLLPFLSEFRVVGVDVSPLPERGEIAVHPLDLGRESSCIQLVRLLRETGAESVVHLAFVDDPPRTAESDRERMWQINVAGTARVMEAISEVNRHGGNIRKFIYPSSASVYGPETRPLVDEEGRMGAHTLNYAVQKAEAEGVVRFRANSMGKCSTYLLRPQRFAGASVESYMVSALRGYPSANSGPARKRRSKQKRLPLLLPMGKKYPEKLLQFLHLDDMARLVTWLLHQASPEQSKVLTLNVAGSGSPISIARCAEIAQARIVRLPSEWLWTRAMRLRWNRGVSPVPPDAFPYMAGSCTVSTRRLQELLRGDYAKVIQHSTEEALRESFAENLSES
jgi:nucleoside-diphosphate-sugar epimerase